MGVPLGIAIAGSVLVAIIVGRRISKNSDGEKRDQLRSLDGRHVTVALASGGRMSLSVEHTGTLVVGTSPWSVTLLEDKPRVIPVAQVMWVVDVETGQRLLGPRWGSAIPRPTRAPETWAVVTVFCSFWIATAAVVTLMVSVEGLPLPAALAPYLLVPLTMVAIALRRRSAR